jgi:hypothetical protein
MKRRPKGQQPNHQKPTAPPVVHCRAIVLVDGSGIRKKIKKDYEKAVRDLAVAREQLDVFHQSDLPQFTQWLTAQFGALLTELRELSQKLAADEALIFQVEAEVLFGGGGYARAYKRVMEARENPGPPPPPPPGEGGETDPRGARSGKHQKSKDPEDEDDPLEEMFEDIFGEPGPGESAREEHDFGGGLFSDPPVPPPPSSARLKEIYRALVRRLHPDTQAEMTLQKTEWWHQAQAAYEAGDVEQLEVILTLCEIGESGTTAHTSASMLQRMTARLKVSLREIKRQLSGRRGDPAWGFSRRADRTVLAAQMRNALTADLQGMRDRWQEIQEVIAAWKAAAERIKPPRRKRARPQNTEFPF